MPVTAGPIYPGIKDGLVFAIDPANKDSYTGTGTTAIDLVDNTNGTLQSSGMFENTNAGVFDFDGATNYIGFNSINSSGDISIVCWVYLSSYHVAPTHNPRILHNYDGSHDLQVIIREDNVFKWGTKTQSQGIGISNLPPLNEWLSICLIRSGTSYKVYYNTQEKTGNSSIPGDPQPSISQLRIGADIQGSNSNGHLEGQTGPILIYNRALSASEVTQNYNRLKGRFNL
jgi:hypothetical protein